MKRVSQEPSVNQHVKKRSTNLVDRDTSRVIDKALKETYDCLKLDETGVKAKIGSSKTRNHVNPLQNYLMTPHDKLDWGSIYADPNKPLAVDVGCAAGRFSLLLAKHDKYKEYNHLGFEIRKKLVIRANAWVEELGMKNVHYITASANASLKHVLEDYPGKVDLITIQYPDPHFKPRHHKRRVLQFPLVRDIETVLADGGMLFMQSDVEGIAAEMRDRVDCSTCLKRDGSYTPRDPLLVPAECAKGKLKDFWTRDCKREKEGALDYGDWMVGDNPLGCPTEREVANLSLGNPVYRCIHIKQGEPVTPACLPPGYDDAADSKEDVAEDVEGGAEENEANAKEDAPNAKEAAADAK